MRLKAVFNQPAAMKVVVWVSRGRLVAGAVGFIGFIGYERGSRRKCHGKKAISNRLADQTNQRKGKQLSTAPVTSTRCP